MSNRQERKARKAAQRAAARVARGETGADHLVEWLRGRRQQREIDRAYYDAVYQRILGRG